MIKAESEVLINRLEVQLTASLEVSFYIEPLWDKAISHISELDKLYLNGTVISRRKIISSMFPEKLLFDGIECRTKRINEALVLMPLIDNRLKTKRDKS